MKNVKISLCVYAKGDFFVFGIYLAVGAVTVPINSTVPSYASIA